MAKNDTTKTAPARQAASTAQSPAAAPAVKPKAAGRKTPAKPASRPAAKAPDVNAFADIPVSLNGRALGLIETRGLVAAVEAADSMLKTADVALLGLRCSGAGLVTVLVSGEVSAVQSAVDSGAAAASRLGTVVSTDVIARPADGMEKALA